MKVLLVDDSLTIRSLLQRTLHGLFPVETAHAANGVEALAQINHHRFDLVILDVNMPVMDGVETLEAIRTSPDHAALPVVVLTSERNEAVVRRLVELGVSDFLSKPLRTEVLGERLLKLRNQWLDRAKAALPISHQAGERLRIMVVEQDPDRRHFFTTVLHSHFDVVEADSGAAALQICLAPNQQKLDLVLVGDQIGLPPVEMFVPKLRTLAPASSARMVGCRSSRQASDMRIEHLFDGMVQRSLVPEVFLAELQRIFSGAGRPLGKLLALRPSLRKDIVSATEQVFGIMLSVPVELSDSGSAAATSQPLDGAHATIGLETDGELTLDLRFDASHQTGREIAARMIGVDASEVQDADVLASAAELVNIVMGRLRNRLVETDVHAQIQIPKTWFGDDGSAPVADDPDGIVLHFGSPAANLSFQLTLSAGPKSSG
jgi:CheY-like chemotaxis protein/CheY-specific phosphatase CheX